MNYEIRFHPKWEEYLCKIKDREIEKRIFKLILRHERGDVSCRHIRFGKDYFVEEIGQYRLTFFKNGQSKVFCFVGKHKEYER